MLISLDAMCQGGIYDHLGGGFARYSTDEQWLVPHFEKMLYDNAQLIDFLTSVWQDGSGPKPAFPFITSLRAPPRISGPGMTRNGRRHGDQDTQ